MPAWNKAYNSEIITRRLEENKVIAKDGSTTFINFDLHTNVMLLHSMLFLSEDIPENEKRKIITKATFNSASKGIINSKTLLIEIAKLEKKFLSTPKQKFKLLSSISISKSNKIPNIFFNGSCIKINGKWSKKAHIEHNNLVSTAKRSITNDLPSFYSPVSVTVHARSASEAADKALNRLDFIRGIWNLAINRNKTSRRSFGLRKPVNDFILGPCSCPR